MNERIQPESCTSVGIIQILNFPENDPLELMITQDVEKIIKYQLFHPLNTIIPLADNPPAL